MLQSVEILIISIIAGIYSGNTDGDKICNWFKNKEIAEMSDYFNSTVQISTANEDGIYSKAQAKMIMQEFFNSHTINAAILLSNENSGAGSANAKCKVHTNKHNYITEVMYRGSGTNLHIHQIKMQIEGK